MSDLQGKAIRLNSAKGIIERIVVDDYGDVVTVSSAAEIQRAKREGRRPHTAGFKRTDIVP